jgi:D-serine deaminase-like pyridoxal phosphate-dependent protein
MYPYPATPKQDLDTPALCLDIAVAEANIQRMAAYVNKAGGVRLRPHSKTHKSPMLALRQLQAGAIGITCAKLGEAEVMAQAGIRDLLIANQIIGPLKIARLVNLAAYTDVMVAVDSADNARALSAAAVDKGLRLRGIIEVDIGMGRCGTLPGDETLALARAMVALPGLHFEGIMGYEGHTVMIPGFEERKHKALSDLARLTATADMLREDGIPVGIVSAGGTGTYAITSAVPGITELQVGSYATMDAQYRETVGIRFDYALTVLSSVISTRGGDHAVIDAGLKTMTRDFCLPLVLSPTGWQIDHLSEEHATLKREDGPPLRTGDKVEIVPNHGCTTINLHDYYHVIRDGRLEALWPIAGRGKVR